MNTFLSPINDIDSQLAVELATQISPVKDVLARHSLTSKQLREKLKETRFQQMILEAKRVWSSDLSVRERIRVKSAVLVEDSLLQLYGIFQDSGVAVPARLEAFKSLAKVATVYEPEKNQQAAGERVSITFNIGKDRAGVTIEGVSQPVSDEAA